MIPDMKNTTQDQDNIIEDATDAVEDVLDSLRDIIEDLDEQLTKSIAEANELRAYIDSMEERVGLYERRVEELQTELAEASLEKEDGQ